MHENKQISSRARKLLPSAVWANVRWKRDGYYRTSPNQNRRWLVVGFRNSTHFVGKIAAVLRTQTSALSRFCHPNKKKKKKKKKKKRTFVVSGGVRPNPPNPPCVRACLIYPHTVSLYRYPVPYQTDVPASSTFIQAFTSPPPPPPSISFTPRHLFFISPFTLAVLLGYWARVENNNNNSRRRGRSRVASEDNSNHPPFCFRRQLPSKKKMSCYCSGFGNETAHAREAIFIAWASHF